MRILITGATGFVGGNLVPILDNFHVRCLVRQNIYIKNVEIFVGDITNKTTLEGVGDGIGAVIHLAALFGFKRLNKSDSQIMNVNVLGTKNLIEYCKDVKHFIFASTWLADYPKELGVYAQSKAEAEDIVRSSGLNYTIIRFPSMYNSMKTKILAYLFFPIYHLLRHGKMTDVKPLDVKDVCETVKNTIMDKRCFNNTYYVVERDKLVSREDFFKC